jgi:hypothetical protein
MMAASSVRRWFGPILAREPDSKKSWSASSSLFEVRKMEEALPYFLLTSVSHSSDFPEARAVFSQSLVHAAMVGPGIPLRWV